MGENSEEVVSTVSRCALSPPAVKGRDVPPLKCRFHRATCAGTAQWTLSHQLHSLVPPSPHLPSHWPIRSSPTPNLSLSITTNSKVSLPPLVPTVSALYSGDLLCEQLNLSLSITGVRQDKHGYTGASGATFNSDTYHCQH